MNANKQDAGELPSGMVMVQRIDAERLAMSICDEDSASERLSARRVLELCRAAPAGSGEAEELAKLFEEIADSAQRSLTSHVTVSAKSIRDAAALLRKLQQGAECFVREMRTSKGSEFFVVVRCNGRELTPHMYAERWKAEYDVASWQHLLSGAPEPDILAYGPASQGQDGGKA